MADVRAFWEDFARQSGVDPAAAVAMTAQAVKASRAAQAKRKGRQATEDAA